MDKGEWVNFLCLQMEERRRQVQEDHEREYQVSISSTFYMQLLYAHIPKVKKRLIT